MVRRSVRRQPTPKYRDKGSCKWNSLQVTAVTTTSLTMVRPSARVPRSTVGASLHWQTRISGAHAEALLILPPHRQRPLQPLQPHMPFATAPRIFSTIFGTSPGCGKHSSSRSRWLALTLPDPARTRLKRCDAAIKASTSMASVAAARSHALECLFGRRHGVAIGVVHLRPLPGSPSYQRRVAERRLRAGAGGCAAYAEAGFDGLIVENHGDVPFLKPELLGPETAAMMAVAAERVRREVGLLDRHQCPGERSPSCPGDRARGGRRLRPRQPVGQRLRRQRGLHRGACRRRLCAIVASLAADEVRIFADSHVKHGSHAITADRSVAELTRDLEWSHGRRGDRHRPAHRRCAPAQARPPPSAAATTLPLLVGSGVTAANVAAVLRQADGVIVASSLKVDGVWWNPVDPERARAFIKAATGLR